MKGSIEYHERVDFRAFDVMVHAIGKASPDELTTAWRTAKEMSADLRKPASSRIIWRDFARMLNRARKS